MEPPDVAATIMEPFRRMTCAADSCHARAGVMVAAGPIFLYLCPRHAEALSDRLEAILQGILFI